jgi:hypothetical protein
MVAMADVATGATVADNDAVGTVIPPSLTKDKGTYVGMLLTFEGTCVSAFADGALNPWQARWGTRTTAHIDSIVAGKGIVVVIIVVVVVVVSRVEAAEDGVVLVVLSVH